MDDANEVARLMTNPSKTRAVANPSPATQNLGPAWLGRLIPALYFQRVALINPERLPARGPVLYVGLHRNGAVDGFVYRRVLRQPVFLISTQLRRSWFARLLFQGIAVTRTKDGGDRAQNAAALQQCLDHLRSGGELFVFPEGTSSLGPRHLPFKSGAAWLLLDYLAEVGRPPLTVVPLGIHYECPWAFRSRVEVVVGTPITTGLPAEAGRVERLKIIKRRMQTALEAVGINVRSSEHQAAMECLAYLATLDTGRSYFKTLKALESIASEEMLAEWRDLQRDFQHADLWLHQGVPLYPVGSVVWNLMEWGLACLIVITAIAVNLPPFAAGWYAGKKFPDDRNVISLWRILVGFPVFGLWVGLVAASLVLLGNGGGLAAYLLLTYLGLKLYHDFKKLSVAVHNVMRQPGLRSRLEVIQRSVLNLLPDENA